MEYVIFGFIVLLIGCFAYVFLWRKEPGAKNLVREIRAGSVGGIIRVLLTQRLFGFEDTVNRPLKRREIVFIAVLLCVGIIAVIFF